MASFFVIRGQDHGRHFVVRGDTANIGRDSNNQIRLNDTEVSRLHAKIARTSESEFELHDSGSSNGTFVNSQQIRSVVLHSGDRVQLGRTLMIFTGGPEIHSQHPPVRSYRPLDQVEIVAEEIGDLGQIRSRAESFCGTLPIRTTKSASSGKGLSSTGFFEVRSPVAELNEGEIVYQVSQAIRQTIDISELLTKVLDLIFQWIECDRGCILLQDEITGGIRPSCTRRRGRSGSSTPRPMQISRSILDHVMNSKEGVLTSNAQDDTRWERGASIAGLGIREAICVPMHGRYGVQGAIYVDTEMSAGQYAQLGGTPRFNERHLKLVIAIAGQAALAIEDTQFYRALLQSERLATMGQTIADVSHHVKNILQGINGGNYLVEDGLNQQNLQIIQKGWAVVKKNQDRISSLVMDMLSFSKDRQPDLQPVDVNHVVSEVTELMQVRAQETGVNLSVRLLSEPRITLIDGEGIHHALLNVITNAIDAAASSEPEHSTGPTVDVVVECSQDDQRISISVKDNGDGIPEELQSKVFAPFQSSKGSRGTGLGLTVSQKILREHGGDLSLESQVGKGSTFTLSWPVGVNSSRQTLTG